MAIVGDLLADFQFNWMMVNKFDSKRNSKERALLLSSSNGWSQEPDRLIWLENPSFSATFRGGLLSVKKGAASSAIGGDPIGFVEDMAKQGYFAFGYLGYEYFKYLMGDFAPRSGKQGRQYPDASFLFFREDEIIQERIKDTYLAQAGTVVRKPVPNMSKQDYINKVNTARRYIASGDIYQVNLSQKFEVPFEVDPEKFLYRLYNAQPVPFSCLIDFADHQLVSGSMELFLQKHGRQIISRPIKGTRKRGSGKLEDERLRDELLDNAKERAENLMIVDLMRNDLGRVCEFGSVKVNKLFEVEPYTTLFQMVSEVEGRLRDDATASQIILNTFPPGSVTGAPKRRAMEIIDELEPHLRGPYCGAIGLFRPDGDFTLSVAIRVLAASRGVGEFWVGGGIMWDSVPELEYEETLIKAEAMLRALG